jgi:tetratricopeptide (TPR) repeat protein
MTALNDPNNVAFANPKAWALHDKGIAEFKDLKTQELAIKHIEQAISIDPKNAMLWQVKAAFLQGIQESEKALPCIKKSIQLNRKPDYPYVLKAEILKSLKRFSEALSAVDYAIKINSRPEYFVVRSKIFMEQGKLDLAEKEMDKLVDHYPTNTLIHSQRALIARRLKHWPKAIEDFTYLIDKAPVKTTSYYGDLLSRAQAYTETKQYDKGIADCKAGLKGLPEARQFHAALIKLYELSGNEIEAKRTKQQLDLLDDELQPPKSDRF